MIQLKSVLTCIDNSGAALVSLALQIKQPRRAAKVGDKIVVVVQKQRTFASETHAKAGSSSSTSVVSAANKVRRGDIRHAVVVRCRKSWQRKDGSTVGFEDNACVLINKGGDPIGTRINGVVARELRERGWGKILSLAPAYL